MLQHILPKGKMGQEGGHVAGVRSGEDGFAGRDLLQMFIVGQGQHEGQVLGVMADGELSAQLAVEGTETRGHESRQVACQDPILERFGMRDGLEDVEQAGPREIAGAAVVVDMINEKIA